MRHFYHMTLCSGNQKTGPIPVTTSSKSTCPTACGLAGEGCYAEHGPMALHWRKVSAGERGGTLEEICTDIKRLPKNQLWRWGQAGDLPGDGKRIDKQGLAQLVAANKGRKGFSYTHYSPTDPHNAEQIRRANQEGFTVNLSAESLQQADALAALDIAPVACVMPIDAEKVTKTPGGRSVVLCPASTTEGVSCATCGICAVTPRKSIIGFPAHGSGKLKAQKVFFKRRDS